MKTNKSRFPLTELRAKDDGPPGKRRRPDHASDEPSVVVVRSERRCFVRSTLSTVTFPIAVAIVIGLALLLLVLLLLAGCYTPRAQKGGSATSTFSRPGHTNAVTLVQSENPKEPSRQTAQSEQLIEYVLPPGSAIHLAEIEPLKPATNPPAAGCIAMLQQPVPVRIVARDRTETMIGGAQKNTLQEWAGKASNVRPVMWVGIMMMTVVAGTFIYFGWWTKAAVAIGVGFAMVLVAQTLPDHTTAVLLGGLGLFAVAALLVLYAYYKGQLDRNQNGIPDFLERSREIPIPGGKTQS